MNPELLTCRHLTAGLVYPPLSIVPADLNRMYAKITEKYPYQSLQHLPDGVRMSNPDGDCFIQLNRMQINENVMYFEASKAKCLDMFHLFEEGIGAKQFLTFGIKLTAFLPMDEGEDASTFLDAKAFAMAGNQWNLLGSGRKGAGLRIVLQQDGLRELKIEPFFNDPTQLYVELDTQHAEPFIGLSGIDEKMDNAYNFMFNNVKSFLASMR